jgi:signal transduction histidine kinase
MSKVLVAEDEPALLDSFCELISALGHEAVAAQDGTQALDLARRQHPDLVVTDLMMPGRTGLELIRALRTDTKLASVPVILLSAGRPSEADKKQAWLFLAKPVNLDNFEKAINDGLATAQKARPEQTFSASPDSRVSPLALAREAMLSWVAHEIKSPLSAALTAAQLAMRDLDSHEEPATLKRRLTLIARQLVRMDELATSILEAAQLQEDKLELELEELDLGAWLAELVGLWKELYPDYSFQVQEGKALLVKADRERLRQVLDNLISNAIKYGGPSKLVRIALGANDTRVFISVTDQGRGIAPEELPHIFDRFHRVAGQGGRGHGLGLYIAAALARLHGGELNVESALGRGSTFTLSVPRT